MDDLPKVSIGIPTFNRSQHLRKTIEAVLSQTFFDLELVICDDASTDETAEVVASYEDHRIRYIRNPKNLGLYQNINRCIELSSGEYVAVYHDHDDYLPTIVEESVKLLDAHPNVGFVHTAIQTKTSHGEIVNTFVGDWPVVTDGRTFAEKIAQRWDSPICGAVAMIRKSLFDKGGCFDAQLGAGADIDVWVKLALLSDVGYVAKPLAIILMRQSGDTYAGFDWSDLVKHFRLIERNLQRVYGNVPRRLAWHQRKYSFSRDWKLLEMFCREIVKPEAINHNEGIAVLKAEGSFWVRLIGNLFSQYPKVFSNILYPVLIAYRIWWKLRINAEQRRASQILARDRDK